MSSRQPSPAVRLSGVNKTFGDTVAVRDLDLTVPRGAMYGLLGPNGAGKTTAIRIMLDILGPDSGEVELFGRRVDDRVRTRVGYLPEERGLYQKMGVLDHVVFLAVLKGMDRDAARSEGRAWLERFDLADRADAQVDELSKGMQQKVQFISTIIHEPDLLILDEPFSGLDPINVDLLRTIVVERSRAGTTVLFSTHMIEDAEQLCDRVCMIAGARKVLDGPIDEVKERFGTREIEVELAGDPGELDAIAGVQDVIRSDGNLRVRTRGEEDAQGVVRRALDAGVTVRRMEVVEPALRDIFLEMARRKGLEEEAIEGGEAGTGPPGARAAPGEPEAVAGGGGVRAGREGGDR